MIDHSWDDYLLFRIKNNAGYRVARQKIDDADTMFDDLPDGAYWAACEEFGAGQDLQLAVNVYEEENKLGVHAPSKKKNHKGEV